MDRKVVHTETNRGNACVIVNGYTYRKARVMKNGSVTYRCSNKKMCKASVILDKEGKTIIKTRNKHIHGADKEKTMAQKFRVSVRKHAADIFTTPSKVAENEVRKTKDKLRPKDVKNAALSLYRERKRLTSGCSMVPKKLLVKYYPFPSPSIKFDLSEDNQNTENHGHDFEDNDNIFEENISEMCAATELQDVKLKRTLQKGKEPTKTYDSDKENRISQLKSKVADLESRLQNQRNENDKLKKELDDVRKERDKIRSEHEKTITNIKQNVNEPVDATLKLELERIKTENDQLKIKQSGLESDVDSLRTSLSKVAGSKLTDSNPFIADLSDPHRPEKLAEKFASLYDNDWTDAYETFKTQSEEETCKNLINIFQGCWNYSFEMARRQLLELRRTFLSLENVVENGKKSDEVKDNTPIQSSKLIKDTRKLFAQALVPQLCQHYWDTECNELDESVRPYVDACIDLCWYSAVSDPPLDFAFEVEIPDNFRPFTKNGTTLDFIVWPAMYLYQNGPLMYKGVAQYKSDLESANDL